MTENRYDVLIVGSRIAGAVTASFLGAAGISTLLIDKGTFPSPTLSSHIMGDILDVFQELNILERALAFGSPPLYRSYWYKDGSNVAEIKENFGSEKLGRCIWKKAPN